MRKLKFEECPKTRAEFVRKYKEDNIFKAKAEYSGFKVIFDNVILPNGKVAPTNLKQLADANYSPFAQWYGTRLLIVTARVRIPQGELNLNSFFDPFPYEGQRKLTLIFFIFFLTNSSACVIMAAGARTLYYVCRPDFCQQAVLTNFESEFCAICTLYQLPKCDIIILSRGKDKLRKDSQGLGA